MSFNHTSVRSNRIRAVKHPARAPKTANRIAAACDAFELLESRRLMSATGLQGQYFDSTDLTAPVFQRTDAAINLNWGNQNPIQSADSSAFSARWTGQVTAPTDGAYTFFTRADDGVRLWVNGKLLVDRWSDVNLAGDINHDGMVDSVDFNIITQHYGTNSGATSDMGDLNGDGAVNRRDTQVLKSNWSNLALAPENSGTITLQAGKSYDIKLEYYNHTGMGQVQLMWSGPGIKKTIIPTSQLSPGPISDPLPPVDPAPTPDPVPTPTPVELSISSLTLINADTDQAIMTLKDGATLDLAKLPTRNLNVSATTAGGTVGSVKFALDSNSNVTTQNVAPYALGGDDNGNFRAWTPAKGAHTLTATPFTQADAAGTAGKALTVHFTVTDSGTGTPAPNPTPVPTPTPTPTPAPVPPPTNGGTTTPPVAGNWQLIFNEGFDTNPLQNGYVMNMWGHNGMIGAGTDSSHVTTANGILSLTATRNSGGGFTSGQIQSGGDLATGGKTAPKFGFQYGYIEARVNIPDGTGLWPAFWMMPVPNPTFHDGDGEIDIFDNGSGNPNDLSGGTYRHGSHFGHDNVADLSGGWHTVGMDWQADHITWYVDGKAVSSMTTTDQSKIPQTKMYFILGLQINDGQLWGPAPNSSTSFPASLDVDYVRVWQNA